MKINCDLGEGMPQVDRAVMPYIDMANLACGGHSGDRDSLLSVLQLCHEHSVAAGAHPAYPDREHFGRRSLDIDVATLEKSLRQQLQLFLQCCQETGVQASHIKPHGALYHDCRRDRRIANCLLRLAAELKLPLILQAAPDYPELLDDAAENGVEISREAFADRAYADDGSLIPRAELGALLEPQAALAQFIDLRDKGGLNSREGRWLKLRADTICVHGDSPDALKIAELLHGARH